MSFDIKSWITATNLAHQHKRHSCSQLGTHFAGFFSPELLSSAGFVIVDELPRPPIDVIMQLGLGQLLNPNAVGITLDDTYYLKPKAAGQLRVHFHELVHVLQWQALGQASFIKRYISEVIKYGYRQAPLEEKAYGFEDRFVENPRDAFLILAKDTI
ncbi:hypothetical protein CBP31_09940 [Oceanisphaera profunda]|uniref:DUF4157 domain-containing protein n=1 Tax=Oceanisphaera profunda TaxID=1416627 RepID=A0A1Y0D6T0_9GAMM|nr:hypothetical protein [Oceanisphaera profunda]ART82907.1 hypothetical protein CBP31_09940 [Oceanisphaera profunda]